jgi:hypothetical protein
MSWIHSLPSPVDQCSIWSLRAYWDIFKIIVKSLILEHNKNIKIIYFKIVFISFGLSAYAIP